MKYSTAELIKGSKLVDDDLLREWSEEMSELRTSIRQMDEKGQRSFRDLLAEIEALPDNWSPTDGDLANLIQDKGKKHWEYSRLVDKLKWLTENPPVVPSELTVFLGTVDVTHLSDNDLKSSGVEIHYAGLGKYAVRAAREEN